MKIGLLLVVALALAVPVSAQEESPLGGLEANMFNSVSLDRGDGLVKPGPFRVGARIGYGYDRVVIGGDVLWNPASWEPVGSTVELGYHATEAVTLLGYVGCAEGDEPCSDEWEVNAVGVAARLDAFGGYLELRVGQLDGEEPEMDVGVRVSFGL